MNSILLNPSLAYWFELDIKPLLPNLKSIASSLSLDIVVLNTHVQCGIVCQR